MAVQFTPWDYFGSMLLLIVAPFVLFLLIGIPFQRYLFRKTKNTGISLLPMLLIFPLMMVLFRYVLPAGERTGCLYPKENAYTHTTAGTITEVRPADHIPLYYHDGEFRGGVYVTMDGIEYYSMAHPMLTEGSALHFTYCPKDDLIMAFSPIVAGEVNSLQKPFVMPESQPEEPVPKLQLIIGSICFWSGFLAFALLIKAKDWITPRLAVYLLSHDRNQLGAVVPNPAAAVASAARVLPISLIILGNVLSRNAWSLLFVLVLGAPMMLLFPRLCAAHVRLEGRNIRIRRFGRERTVPISTLRAVYWSQHKQHFTNRRLVLVFDGWTLELDQLSHLGLYDLHRRLTTLLQISQ